MKFIQFVGILMRRVVVQGAEANGLEPYAYLRFLFAELPKAKLEAEIMVLLPQYVDRNRLAVIS